MSHRKLYGVGAVGLVVVALLLRTTILRSTASTTSTFVDRDASETSIEASAIGSFHPQHQSGSERRAVEGHLIDIDADASLTNSEGPQDWAQEWLHDCDDLRPDGNGLACILCGHDYECDTNQGCAINRKTGHQECVSSNCRDDTDCPDSWRCRAVGHDQKIRRCIEHGIRALGERCAFDPTGKDWSCQEGLICFQYQCVEPCSAGTCPPNKDCWPSPDGPVCYRTPPTCQETGCPAGERCETVNGAHMCIAKTIGDNCDLHPCPAGKQCEVRVEGNIAQYYCGTTCSPLAPKCGHEEICGQSQTDPRGSVCYRQCGANGYRCPQGEVCQTVSEDHKMWGCVPFPGTLPKPPRD